MEDRELTNRFTYHPPKDGQPELYQSIREMGGKLALFINRTCPESREKSLSLTALDEVVMWANASIARHGSEHSEPESARS